MACLLTREEWWHAYLLERRGGMLTREEGWHAYLLERRGGMLTY